MISLTKENHLLLETLRYLQDKINGPPDDDKENKVLLQLSQIILNLPSLISLEHIVKRKNVSHLTVFHEVN